MLLLQRVLKNANDKVERWKAGTVKWAVYKHFAPIYNHDRQFE